MGKKPRVYKTEPDLSVTRVTLIIAASVAFTLFFYILISSVPAVASALGSATASVTGGVLAFLGMDVTVNGTLIQMSGFTFQLVPDCTPLPPVMLLTGAILAFPTSWRAKGIGIIAGAALLSVLNLVRTVSLAYIGLYFPQWLDVMHHIIWQSVMILAGIIVWLFWMKRYSHRAYA